jgi:hypothetical protein
MPEGQQFIFGPWNAGLVNTVGEHDIPPDGLSVAENLDIDRKGVVTTRSKWALQDAEHYTSIFKHLDTRYAVRGASTRQVGIVGESTFTPIAVVAGPVSWTVLNGEPMYTDGEVIRIIRNGSAEAIDEGYYQHGEDDEYQFAPIPGGSEIHYWQGRLLIARGTSLLWSDALRYGVYSTTRNFVRFPEKIHWVAPLISGVYVGTRSHVYFLSGSDPAKFTQQVVGGASAPGASAVYNPRHVEVEQEYVALWFTSDGIAIGSQSGSVTYPQAERLKGLPLYPGKMVVENDRVTIFTTKEH